MVLLIRNDILCALFFNGAPRPNFFFVFGPSVNLGLLLLLLGQALLLLRLLLDQAPNLAQATLLVFLLLLLVLQLLLLRLQHKLCRALRRWRLSSAEAGTRGSA